MTCNSSQSVSQEHSVQRILYPLCSLTVFWSTTSFTLPK